MHGQEERKSGKGRRKRSSNIPFCLAGQLNTIMTAATLCFCPAELKKETCWDGKWRISDRKNELWASRI